MSVNEECPKSESKNPASIGLSHSRDTFRGVRVQTART